ncbi:dimethylamine monooxygenase subunit DmmA family protein [Nocardia mangyaensis]|nr:dimethylamine monooxygenase subunit DmmA family protein [Nocardia mangyaensis]
MANTSVPRWSARSVGSVEFDSRTPCYLVFVTDVRALADVATHRARIPAPSTVVDTRVVDVDAALASARTGWRFLVVGDGAGVARIRARIVAAGAIDEELITVVLGADDGFDAGTREVFCAHCRSTTATGARIDETMTCGGCGVELVVYYHFSRRRHAYLGYSADAENLS